MVGIVRMRGGWRHQPLGYMSTPQLEVLAQEGSFEAEVLLNQRRAAVRDFYSPMAQPTDRYGRVGAET